MTPSPQTTVQRAAEVRGRALHNGQLITARVEPAAPNTGITFVRADLPSAPEVPATLDHIRPLDLMRRTTIAQGDATVATIEHLMSAAAALRIDNLRVVLDGPEIPFLDGSAQPFVELLETCEISELAEPRRPSPSVARTWNFQLDDAEITVMPCDDYRITFFFTSEEPLLRAQAFDIIVSPDSYRAEIAPARTFAFFHEVEALRTAGLIRGASLASAVVIGRRSVINNSLRFADEPVRHKILDFIGDLALLSPHICGHFLVHRAGHRVNAAFAQALRQELSL